MKIKIGVLTPHSKNYPTLGKEYINGLKLGLKNARLDCSFIIEGIGFGADEKTIIDKAQKLTNQDDVAIITGLLGHKGIEELTTYAENMEVVLLYSDLGATIPNIKNTNSWAFCNSYELYKSAILLGKNAPKWGHSNIAISASYYDCGYGFTEALEKSLYDSGGVFSGHFITPLHPRENESVLIEEFAKEIKPDAIYAMQSGVYAQEYAEYLAKNKISNYIPFYFTPFGIDEQLIAPNQLIYEGAKCISSWFIEEENKNNQSFVANYKNEYDKIPSSFAMLGYENGLILTEVINKLEGNNLKANQIKEMLAKVIVEGPRGKIFFDDDLHRTSFPQYLWEIINNNGSFTKLKKEKLELDLDQTKSILKESASEIGGWDNAYLCN